MAMSPDTHQQANPNGDSSSILSRYPFYTVDGVPNFRDIGGYPCSPSLSKPDEPPRRVKRNQIFRSGETAGITGEGKEAIKRLGIRKVFDLRSDFEVAKYSLSEVEIDGVELERVGIKEGVWYDPISLEMRLQGYATDEVNTFIKSYTRIAKDFAVSYEKIIRHIVSHPDQPCLVHCTAGKDRTGVFVALLLMLLGVSDSTIASEYALTTHGIKPLLPRLEERFRAQTGFKDNWEGTLGMCRSRPESMLGTLSNIREEYGSAEGYFLQMTSLEAADIERVKDALVVVSSTSEEGTDLSMASL